MTGSGWGPKLSYTPEEPRLTRARFPRDSWGVLGAILVLRRGSLGGLGSRPKVG